MQTAGCVGGEDGVAARSFGLVFATDESTECMTPPETTGRLPDDVDWVVAALVETDGKEQYVITIREEDLEVQGEALMTGVAPGVYSLHVTGCRDTKPPKATWGGTSRPFEVKESQKAAPIVFMTRAGAMSCIGGENQIPLAPEFKGADFLADGRSSFAAGTVTTDGRVFVSGGFVKYKDPGAVYTLYTGRHVWEFHRQTGVFTGVFNTVGDRLELLEKRAMHGMEEASDGSGRLLVIGGISNAELAPSGFPGHKAPLDNAEPVQTTLEVLYLDEAKSVPVALPTVDVMPSWALDTKVGWAALAGGRRDTDGLPSDRILFIQADPDKLVDDNATNMEGVLSVPRFGGTARFLSTGELLLIGGWDGSKAAPPELVRRNDTGGLESRLLGIDGPPDGTWQAAFQSTILLSDDGNVVRVLVMGGNPLDAGSMPFGNPDPGRPTTWLLEMESGGEATYDTETAKAIPLGADQPDWAARSMASLVRVGQSLFMAGGYRAFNEKPDVAGCGVVWGYFCFPRTVSMFTMDDTVMDLQGASVLEGMKSRLGALVLPLDEDIVMVLGGMDGYGNSKPDDPGNPPPPGKTPILSTGYLLVDDDGFDSGTCASNPPVTPQSGS